jgi:hypothetical protein
MHIFTTEYLECDKIFSKNSENAFPITSSGYLRFCFEKEHQSIKSICLFKKKQDLKPIIKIAVFFYNGFY